MKLKHFTLALLLGASNHTDYAATPSSSKAEQAAWYLSQEGQGWKARFFDDATHRDLVISRKHFGRSAKEAEVNNTFTQNKPIRGLDFHRKHGAVNVAKLNEPLYRKRATFESHQTKSSYNQKSYLAKKLGTGIKLLEKNTPKQKAFLS